MRGKSNGHSELEVGKNEPVEAQLEATRDDNHPESAEQSTKNVITWKLYVSRLLSAWSDRLWQFGAGIFMYKLAPNDLRLVAIFGLAIMLSSTLFGAAIGDWIDKQPRLVAARIFLLVQNTMTALCCVIFAIYFRFESESPDWIHKFVPVFTIVVASLAALASLGCKIVVEKDWIPAIAGGDEDVLAAMNSRFRVLDLTCNLLAPMIAGLLFVIGTFEAAVFIGVWNVVSCPFEYGLLLSIFNDFPVLSEKALTEEGLQPETPHAVEDVQETSLSSTPSSSWRDILTTTQHGWQLYLQHPVLPAALALALVYMTVLGFDNITYAYIIAQCVSELVLGVFVGISAVVGVAAAAAFPQLQKRLGLQKTGLVGMVWLVVSLAACVLSMWLPGSPFGDKEDNGDAGECLDPSNFLSVYVFLTGIVISRFGLWLVDLSISTIMQIYIKEEHRGILGGVQGSMQQFFDILKFVLAICLPSMGTFGWLVLCSYLFYCAAACSYFIFVRSTETDVKHNLETG